MLFRAVNCQGSSDLAAAPKWIYLRKELTGDRLQEKGHGGERTEQKKAKRKVVLAGPWVEPGVQRANAWVVLQRGPL